MATAAALILLAGAYPLARAWRANRRTSLAHALAWALLTWASWLGGAGAAALGWGDAVAGPYLALCLTGCAGVAVLGARRPGVGAWNLVVAGLLVVLLLPLAEGFGRLTLSGPRLAFLACALGVALLNYLPTRLFAAAISMALGCAMVVWSLAAGDGGWLVGGGYLAVAAAPWAAFAALRPSGELSAAFDPTWRRFRDRFGALWAERLREQFNRAAANAGLSGRLGWGGLHGARAGEQDQLLTVLRALLKRFEAAEAAD